MRPTLPSGDRRPSPLATGLLRGHFRLAGVTGPVASVVAAVDVACWDALAIAAGLPLVRLLGGEPRPIPAYNSNGLGLHGARGRRPTKPLNFWRTDSAR